MNPNRSIKRAAFTLIELLIVITIIGVLAALGLVGITAGRKAILGRAIAMELESLSQSIEAYKLKYGSYPPDGSNFEAFKAHFRAAFPNILESEFNAVDLAASGPNGTLMDGAEALVFCLGGFSKDATRPFTGSGGPLKGTGYNFDRNEPFFELSQDRLRIDDETIFEVLNSDNTAVPADQMPVYVPRGRSAPIVYFASSTYRIDSGTVSYFNTYHTRRIGTARPYKSELTNNSLTAGVSVSINDRFLRYMNDKSFQLISAGLNDHFGGTNTLYTDGTPHFFAFPSGQPKYIGLGTITPVGANYSEALDPLFPQAAPELIGQIEQRDNVTNFSEGPLSDSLP